jgi:hypothetical protein
MQYLTSNQTEMYSEVQFVIILSNIYFSQFVSITREVLHFQINQKMQVLLSFFFHHPWIMLLKEFHIFFNEHNAFNKSSPSRWVSTSMPSPLSSLSELISGRGGIVIGGRGGMAMGGTAVSAG